MKKIYTLLVASFCITAVNAQYILTATHVPAIGDVEIVVIDTLPSVIPGPEGANQTWDLSGIKNQDTITTNYVDPSTTQFGSEFPSANVAADQGGLIGYLSANSALVKMIGVALDAEIFGTQTQGFSDVNPSDTLMIVQSMYEGGYTDSSYYQISAYYGGTIQGFQIDSIRRTESKKEEVLFDGYGTVITPNGTFANSLREKVITRTVKLEEGYAFLFGGWFSPGGEQVEETVVYNWYTSGIKFPIASVTTENIGGSTIEASYNNSAEVVSVNSLTANNTSITLYPNPVVESVMITGTNANQIAYVYDAMGRMVLSAKLNSEMTPLSLKNLTKGTYQLQVLEQGVQVTVESFVKQ